VESPEAHLGRAYADLASDRYDDAVSEFRAALALDPSLEMRARFPLAVALFQSQKLDDARHEFEQVRTAAGDQPDLEYYLGRIDFMQGNFEAAIRELTQAAAKPPFPDTAYHLGSAYLRQGDFADAEKWLHKAETAAPTDVHVCERLAALYRQEGRASDAEKALERASQLRQRDAETENERLACAQKIESSSLDAARAVCERLFDPADPAKLTMLGTIYGQHGDFEDALRPLRQAAEVSPASPQMQYNLALVCFRLKRYDEARAALLGAVKQWPDLFQLNSLLGVVLYRLGDLAGAYETLVHAHMLNPRDQDCSAFLYEVSMVLAEKRVAEKDYTPALQCLKRASGLRPDDADPHARMADVYAALGQPVQAQEERQTAERLRAAAIK
jgi:tetratricopeptide (TPR) repeat protein